MSLLQKIQEDLISSDNNIDDILFKLKMFAKKANSKSLIDWVGYELNGYPDNIAIPTYRRVPVNFRGSFLGGSYTMKNHAIPNGLVEKIINKDISTWEVRNGIKSVIAMSMNNNRDIELDMNSYSELFHYKVLNAQCSGFTAITSHIFFLDIITKIRDTVLDLVIDLEQNNKSLLGIDIKYISANKISDTTIVNQTFHQIITTQNMNIAETISYVEQGNLPSLEKKLSDLGLTKDIIDSLINSVENDKDSKSAGWIKSLAQKVLDKSSDAVTELVIKAIQSYAGF